MGYRLACVLDSFHYFQTDGTGTGLHGGNISITQGLRTFAQREEIEGMELFVEPSILSNPARLQEAARLVLPEWRQGKGFLQFLSLHSLPEVLSDGKERVLWSVDVRRCSRDRQARDSYAAGPTPICWDSHSLGSFYFYWDLMAAAHFQPVSSDRVMAISQDLGKGLDNLFHHIRPDLPGFLCPWETHIHHVDITRFEPPDEARKKLLRRTFGLSEEGVIVLFLGRLTPHAKSDLMPLVERFAEEKGLEAHLVIAGPENAPNFASVLAERARELGAESRVTVRGPVEPALRHLLYAACDIFAFPGDSTVEALGNTILEAMATGIPVVASDWDGYKDILPDGEAGFRIPCLWMGGLDRIEEMASLSSVDTDYLFQAQTIHIDMEAFMEKLALLIRDHELRARMGAEGRRLAVEAYSIEPVLKGLFAMWDRQLEEARRESREEREARRLHASQSPLRFPQTAALSHYATRRVRGDDKVQLTAKGRKVKAGQAKLRFYDDTLTMVSGPAMELILWTAGQGEATVESLCSLLEARLGASEALARMQIALLCKQGALSIRVD